MLFQAFAIRLPNLKYDQALLLFREIKFKIFSKLILWKDWLGIFIESYGGSFILVDVCIF